ncbi:protein of unknown function [Burkholderia multivorans]
MARCFNVETIRTASELRAFSNFDRGDGVGCRDAFAKARHAMAIPFGEIGVNPFAFQSGFVGPHLAASMK